MRAWANIHPLQLTNSPSLTGLVVMYVLRKMRKVGCPYHGEQPVDGHSSLLGFHVRHIILDHLVCDAMGELVAQLNDPARGEKQL